MDFKLTEKLYIDNPYLKETHASITDKSFRDGAYLIKLNRTIFFPHMSGGQPRDLGTIEGKEVIDIYEENSEIIHVLKEDIDTKNVDLIIDWHNRFDLMQQHTGQHILSAAFEKLFNAQTVGFHLGKNYTSIDIELDSIEKSETLQIEILTNKIIQSNFNIRTDILKFDEIKDSDHIELSTDADSIRMVNISNISSTPCCGTHVSSTAEVGLLKIIDSEKYKGKIRISFLCGNRALKDYQLKNDIIKDISLSLSSATVDILDKFHKLKEDKEKLEGKYRDLNERFISSYGNELLKNKKSINNIDYIIEDLKNINRQDLSLLSSYLNKNRNLIQIYKLSHEDQGSFLITRSDDLDIDLKTIFQQVTKDIKVKGGGNSKQIQGTVSLNSLDRLIENFYKKIRIYYK